MENVMEDGVIDLPDPNDTGAWTKKYKERPSEAEHLAKSTDTIAVKIDSMKSKAARNQYTLEVYDQVNKVAGFTPKILLALKQYDNSKNPSEKIASVKQLRSLQDEFEMIRENLESVYGKVRILEKPYNYILDHHHHMANQSVNFDWQFRAELLFFEKLTKELENAVYLENADQITK
jgi:hypothetical protein